MIGFWGGKIRFIKKWFFSPLEHLIIEVFLRKDFTFCTKDGVLLPAPFYIWGIVNCTPDSFFDGGQYFSPETSIAQAEKLWNDGAHILDLGGASSRPGAKDIPAELEWERIEETINQVLTFTKHNHTPINSFYKNNFNRPLISVDTWRTKVAKKALMLGIDIINDISAFSYEEDLLELIVEHKPGYVLMHSKGKPQNMQDNPNYIDVVMEVYDFFEKKMNILVQKGLPEHHIILDFGIGFGKNLEHNLTLLQNIEQFYKLGRPILLGLSNKSIFHDLFNLRKDERACITQVCSALMQNYGIKHHRVHDVLATSQSLSLEYILKKVQKD